MTDISLWPRPLPDADSQGFWDAAKEGRFVVCRCRSCGLWMQPPLARCRRCAGPTAFESPSGLGSLHSWIEVNRASVPGIEVPYFITVVEIAEQPAIRFSALAPGITREQLVIGAPVKVSMRPVGPGDIFAPVVELVDVANP